MSIDKIHANRLRAGYAPLTDGEIAAYYSDETDWAAVEAGPLNRRCAVYDGRVDAITDISADGRRAVWNGPSGRREAVSGQLMEVGGRAYFDIDVWVRQID